MKYILAFIIIAFVLFVSTYFLLGVWDIDLISSENFRKTLISSAIILVTSFLLTVFVIIPVFNRSNLKGYNQSSDRIAQKKE